MDVSLTVNGTGHDVAAEAGELLVERLRDGLGLTGTKVGCDTGTCGSCVVRLDGRSVKSCMVLTAQADGGTVETIEGHGRGAELSELQESMRAEHATQCGFCTPGMVMSLGELIERSPRPDEAEVRTWLTGTLCRCTGYHSVVRAVTRATAEQGGEQ